MPVMDVVFLHRLPDDSYLLHKSFIISIFLPRLLPPLLRPAPFSSPFRECPTARRAFANLRQSSLDGLTGRGYHSSSGLGHHHHSSSSVGGGGRAGLIGARPRASSSETNLRKLALNDHHARPGSALGLLQGKTH